MRNLHTQLFCLAALPGLLAACAVGPDYERPAAPAPAAYKENAPPENAAPAGWKTAEPRENLAKGEWWRIFGDPALDALEAELGLANQNIRFAEAQYRQAHAQANAARAALFPSLAANLDLSRGRAASGNSGNSAVQTNRTLSLDASWEADLWGRVRRSVEAGEASAEASAADLENVRLSAQAELAQDYFLLQINAAEKRLLDATVAAYAKTLELTRNLYAAGVGSAADVAQAETQLKTARAQAIDVDVQRAQLEHAIATLIGKPPAALSLPAATRLAELPAIPVGLPSQLLERRPDIAAAERRVAAANAQIGVARAAFFPTLMLSAQGGFMSNAASDWLTAPQRFWSLGPALAQSLFDAGLRRAQNEAAEAAYDATVASYRQTVLAGFQEVEDNLAALRILELEASAQNDAVQAARKSVTLTTNQYRAGTVSYLNVMSAETIALNNERTALTLHGRRLTAAVTLIKALGGTWTPATPQD